MLGSVGPPGPAAGRRGGGCVVWEVAAVGENGVDADRCRREQVVVREWVCQGRRQWEDEVLVALVGLADRDSCDGRIKCQKANLRARQSRSGCQRSGSSSGWRAYRQTTACSNKGWMAVDVGGRCCMCGKRLSRGAGRGTAGGPQRRPDAQGGEAKKRRISAQRSLVLCRTITMPVRGDGDFVYSSRGCQRRGGD